MTDSITRPKSPSPTRNSSPLLSPLGSPERLFKVSTLDFDGEAYHGSMLTGPWLKRQPGISSAGGIGVLMDDTLGAAAMMHRSEDMWAVTTELVLNIVNPVPSDGSRVMSSAVCLANDAEGGISHGRAFASDGRLLAQGTTRVKYSPGIPDRVKRQVTAPPVDSTAGSMSELFSPLPGTSLLETRLPANPLFINPHGSVHGGILLTMVDYAASRYVDGISSLGLSTLQLTYVRPAVGELTIRLKERHHGRSLLAVEAEISGESGKPCVFATVIYRPQGQQN